MEPAEREQLEQVAHHIAKRSRIRMYVALVLAALVFSMLQTVFIVVAGQVANESVRELAHRVDRNVAFTACVLAINPAKRTDALIQQCLRRSNAVLGSHGP